MIYLNLETRVLHAPEYIGSDPKARSTWLSVSLWCGSQENGGRIANGLKWSSRQWQQTCGVTRREVMAAKHLIRIEGDDLVVWNYPTHKEREVIEKRESGRRGGLKSGESRSKKTDVSASSTASSGASTTSPSSASSFASTEGKGKGKEWEGERSASDAATLREAVRTMPRTLDTQVFREAWERWIVHYAEAFGDGRPIPSATADIHLGICLKLGPILALEAIDNAISRKLREPSLPFAGRSGTAPIRHQPAITMAQPDANEDPFK